MHNVSDAGRKNNLYQDQYAYIVVLKMGEEHHRNL